MPKIEGKPRKRKRTIVCGWVCCYCHASGMPLGVEGCPACGTPRCSSCDVVRTIGPRENLIAPAREEPESAALKPTASFAALSLTLSAEQSSTVESGEDITDSIASSLPAFTTKNETGVDKESAKSPSPEPRSSLESRSDFGTSSSTSAKSNSSINHGSDPTMSDLSDSDSMEANDVTLALDRHLLSALDGRLDLAAFLIPEIHDRMDEVVLPPACNLGLNFHRPVKYDDLEDNNAKGKQQASGHILVGAMEPQNLEFTIEDILQGHRYWISELYLNDQETEEEIVELLHERRVFVTLAQVRRCIKDWNLIQLPVVEPFMPSPSPTLSDDWELVSTPSEPEAIPRYTPSDPALIEYNKKPLLSIAIPNPRQNSTKIQKRRPSSTTDRLKQTCHHGSGPSPSQTGGRRLPPSRTRGEGSGDSQGCEDGGDRKRQRRISGGNSEGASGGDGGNGSASNWSGNTGKDPYRSPNRNPDDPGDDPGDDPRDEPGDEPTPAESRDKPNFACHFYKLNPGKYGIWTDDKYKECPGSRITELRRIKYHLQTAHKMSPLYCRRCFRLFSDNAKLSEHYSARTGCEPADRPPSMNDVINDYQWERIEALFRRRGQRGVDDISRWYEIWQILFPGVKEPSNTRAERPGYIAQSNCNAEQLVAEFKRRVDGDIQHGILKPDKQFPHYLHHLRQTLDGLGVCQGLLQLQTAEAGKGEASGPPSTSQSNSMDNDQMSSLDSQSSNVRNTYATILNVHDQGRSGDLGEDVILDNFFQYSASPISNISTSTRDCSISNQQHLDPPLSAWAAMNPHFERSSDMNITLESDLQQQHLQADQVNGGPPNFGSKSLHGHYLGGPHLNILSTFEHSLPSMTTPMINFSNSIQQQIKSRNQDSAWSHSRSQSLQMNNHVTDGFLDTFSETGFSTRALDYIEVSGLPHPEANTSRMATTEANVLPETRMIPSIIERRNSIQTPVGPLNADFANGHQSRQFSSSDVASTENAPNAFFGYDFDIGHSGTSGFTTGERSD